MEKTYRVKGVDDPEKLGVLRQAVEDLPGILDLQFDIGQGLMRIEYDADVIQPDRIAEAIKTAGVTATLRQLSVMQRFSRKGHAIRLLLHGLAGSVIGFFVLHPASRLFNALWSGDGGISSLVQALANCYIDQHLVLSVYFAILGFGLGLLQGLYSWFIDRLAQKSEYLRGQSSLTSAYERLFQVPAHAEPQTAAVAKTSPDIFPEVIHGKGSAPGCAEGPVQLYNAAAEFASFFESHITDTYSPEQIEKAFDATVAQISALQRQARQRLGENVAMIFDAHLMLVEDSSFRGPIEKMVRDGEPAPRAILDVATTYIDKLARSGNPYLEDKAQDLKDIALRLLHNLTGENRGTGFSGCIVVAGELFPSDALQLAVEGASGIVLLSGGLNSHVAILSRSLEMPLVIADSDLSPSMFADTRLLIDGETGDLYVNPPEDTVSAVRNKCRAEQMPDLDEGETTYAPPRTRDDIPIAVKCNLNIPTGMHRESVRGVGGVGLSRTEFAFVGFRRVPTEDEQYHVYRNIVEKAPGRDVTFRAFDLGGDKNFWGVANNGENPLLGVKSTRLLLRNRDILLPQLRALLRATAGFDTRIMFPMISSVEEFAEARQVVFECIEALRGEGKPCNANVEVGLMVETAAVLEIMDELCDRGDFLSLGTNDLVQYLLAADRSRNDVDEFCVPHHPAVLRALARILTVAKKKNTPISVCGDMAHEPLYLPFLLGAGLRELSVELGYIDRVRATISGTNVAEAEEMVRQVLAESDVAAIESLLRTRDNGMD